MLDEVEKFLTDIDISINYRTINLGGKLIYIEGIKNIVSLESEEMQFQLNKQLLKVTGKNLKVKYLDKSTCVLEGEIKNVEVK